MKLVYVAFLGPLLGFAQAGAKGNTVAEFFNDYGVRGDLNTKGVPGNGWLTGWMGSTLPKFQDGALDHASPWFDESGNGIDAHNDGLVNSGAVEAFHLPNPDGVDPNSVALRSFNPFTGTVWISAVTILDDGFPIIGNGEATVLWLEPNSNGVGGENYIAVRSDLGATDSLPEPIIQYGAVVDSSNNSTIDRQLTILMLARLEIDEGGSPNDSLTFWVNPTLTGDVADLEPQAIYGKTGSDVFGPSFDSIGISFGAGLNSIDSIRVSNSPQGAGLLVPEPSTVCALIMAMCSLSLQFRLRAESTFLGGVKGN